MPGVGYVVLPSRSEATPDTPQDGRRIDVEGGGGYADGRGSDGREGPPTPRAHTQPPFTQDTFIGSTTRCTRAPAVFTIRSCQLALKWNHVTMSTLIAEISVESAMAMAAAVSR